MYHILPLIKMATNKQSFLFNLLGKNTYNDCRRYAKYVTIIGSCILAILIPLTFFYHSSIIKWVLELCTGQSLLFIAYIIAWILILDVKVDVDEPETDFWNKPKETPKPITYKFTIAWGVLLILLGLGAIYFSRKYAKHYAFECSTILVDHQQHIYHLDWIGDECENVIETDQLDRMKGYELDDKNYTLCEACEEYAEEVEADGESRFLRR